MNEVFETENFRQRFELLESVEQEWIEKIRTQLRNSLDVGKPLSYWLREKKLTSKRLYFAVNSNTRKVLLLFFAHKRDQQKIINSLQDHKEEHLALIR